MVNLYFYLTKTTHVMFSTHWPMFHYNEQLTLLSNNKITSKVDLVKRFGKNTQSIKGFKR